MIHPEPGAPSLPPLLQASASLTRAEIAEYVLAHEEQVRAVARRKLTHATRTVFDSEDVFASVLRRLDEMVAHGRLTPRSEVELWPLIKAIASNTAVSRTRLIERARNLLTEEGPYAYELLKRLNAYSSDEEAELLVYRMMMALADHKDRQLLALILRGSSHRVAGNLIGISEACSRQRWKKIRDELEGRFARGVLDE
jgi:hypothetical protein